jgi:hypothetical protein
MVMLGATDSLGRFSQELKAGEYEFKVVGEGYETEKKKHRVKAGESKVFEFSLKKD